MAVHFEAVEGPGAVDGPIAPAIVGDGLRSDRRERVGYRILKRTDDGLLLLGRIVLQVVQLLYALSIAMEGLSAGEVTKVLGVGVELVLQLGTHYEVIRSKSYVLE